MTLKSAVFIYSFILCIFAFNFNFAGAIKRSKCLYVCDSFASLFNRKEQKIHIAIDLNRIEQK